ncbi:hypothetical protein ES703_119574 [subsurface metagenome]
MGDAVSSCSTTFSIVPVTTDEVTWTKVAVKGASPVPARDAA